MNRAVRALASVAVFLLIFNVFYTVAPLPFRIVSIEDVERFAPKAYCAPDDRPDRLLAAAKVWKGYTVIEYWYHWPYDGYERRDDWEPVLLLIDGDEVKAVAHRIHYNWRVAYSFPTEDGLPVVTFLYLWHTPMLKEPGEGYVSAGVSPVLGNPPEDIDVGEVFGYGLLPTESAIAAATLYGLLAAGVTYFVTGRIF